jgi:inorganic phosphate transporter, PiT family
MLVSALLLAAVFLAFANGANDNFKGVATLYGSNGASYRTALALATVATLAGSIASVFLADGLIKAFSGKGLVPDTIAASQGFLLAVAFGAALTVMLATRLGFPISTTHALTGALVGAGFIAAGDALNLGQLGTAFFLPLLVSPALAVLIAMPFYAAASRGVKLFGIERESCVCVGPRQFVPVSTMASTMASTLASAGCCDAGCVTSAGLELSVGSSSECVTKYRGYVLGLTAQGLVDGLHYCSAAAVSFARGLNDTPKIAGLLLVVKAFDIRISMIALAAAMALGGLVAARRVAETMSKRISTMNDGQALSANLVTAALVIGASRYGLPVSTTHVSVGAISGAGIVNGTLQGSVLASILLSWVLTLPLAAVAAGLLMWFQNQIV